MKHQVSRTTRLRLQLRLHYPNGVPHIYYLSKEKRWCVSRRPKTCSAYESSLFNKAKRFTSKLNKEN